MTKRKPPVRFFVLPGGKLPERKTTGAIGFDVFLRSVVSPFSMDPSNKDLRKTLFDFKTKPEHSKDVEELNAANHVFEKEGKLVYRMDPGESVLVGVGFVTEMEFPLFYWIAPRSGLSSKFGITVTNAPGTVDPDYRGEAGVLVYNRNDHTFDLEQDFRIAQIIFQVAVIPEVLVAASYEELSKSDRGAGGFGSTGLK
jgi:dUTP pyrophosphatase